jgi:hypothetical protein
VETIDTINPLDSVNILKTDLQSKRGHFPAACCEIVLLLLKVNKLMLKRISKTRQLEDFGLDKVLDWAKKSKVTRGFFVAAVPILGGCAKPPAVEEAPLPSADETATPPIEAAPTETSAPTATLAPTETENPFEGLSICRTWQEAANCPITENDFRRISDYVKANYTFPSEALKVSYLESVPDYNTGYIAIHGLSHEERGTRPGVGVEGDVPGKINIYKSSLSPVGEPFFFNLKKNSPMVNRDTVVAVIPTNNRDGSLGTYTVLAPPIVLADNAPDPDEQTKKGLIRCFEKRFYCPPVVSYGEIPKSFLGRGLQGTFVYDMYQDTIDTNGKRKNLIDEWVKSGVVPKELEVTPIFAKMN